LKNEEELKGRRTDVDTGEMWTSNGFVFSSKVFGFQYAGTTVRTFFERRDTRILEVYEVALG